MSTINRFCGYCGRPVGPRATLRELEGKFLCSGCFRRRSVIEAKMAARDSTPATERQRWFAGVLGIELSPDASMSDATSLLDVEVEKRKAAGTYYRDTGWGPWEPVDEDDLPM